MEGKKLPEKGLMPVVPEGFDPKHLGALARELFEVGDPDWVKASDVEQDAS